MVLTIFEDADSKFTFFFVSYYFTMIFIDLTIGKFNNSSSTVEFNHHKYLICSILLYDKIFEDLILSGLISYGIS